jgi:hypothetical protein
VSVTCACATALESAGVQSAGTPVCDVLPGSGQVVVDCAKAGVADAKKIIAPV